MDRCWLPGASGDAWHALCCALGYNVRWLMRAPRAKARKALSWLLQMVASGGELAIAAMRTGLPGLTAMLRAAEDGTPLRWIAVPVGVAAG